jgi:hypothetical protein
MIPVSVSDIIKLLEQVPIWKRLIQIVKEVEDLKTRVAALEAARGKPPGVATCPICGTGDLKVVSSRQDPTFGVFGVQERTLKCSTPGCDHTEKRQFDPRKDR